MRDPVRIPRMDFVAGSVRITCVPFGQAFSCPRPAFDSAFHGLRLKIPCVAYDAFVFFFFVSGTGTPFSGAPSAVVSFVVSEPITSSLVNSASLSAIYPPSKKKQE